MPSPKKVPAKKKARAAPKRVQPKGAEVTATARDEAINTLATTEAKPGVEHHQLSDILDMFTEKQLTAAQAIFQGFRYVLYGGARGGGKSFWLRWVLVVFLLHHFFVHGRRNLRVGLFCETYPELKDRQISKIQMEFPGWLGELKDTKADGFGFFLHEEFGGGAILLRNLDKPDKYQGAEFAAIAVDELTKTTYTTFNFLRGSLRWPGMTQTPFIAATNPGGIGHLWVKRLWIDGDFLPTPELLPAKADFKFIQALPADNPHLEKVYWDDLNTQPEQIRKAWVLGEWDVFEGQAFPQFSKATHVPTQSIQLPAHWPRWRAVDWGFANPFCCLWFAKDPDTSRVYIYRELYLRQLTDRQQARLIMENTPPTELITITYADPSMWARKNREGQVFTTAQEYANEGVQLTQADNDRLAGKRKVDRILAALPDGLPGLIIMPNCTNLIATLSTLVYDKVNPEDVDTDGEDHAFDTVKYGLTNYNLVAARQQQNQTQVLSPLEQTSHLL